MIPVKMGRSGEGEIIWPSGVNCAVQDWDMRNVRNRPRHYRGLVPVIHL